MPPPSDCSKPETTRFDLTPLFGKSRMKHIYILTIVSGLFYASAQASPITVFTTGDIETPSALFSDLKEEYSFVRANGNLKKPEIIEHTFLEVPDALRKNRKEQHVGVGVILSGKGKSVATAVVHSNSPSLETAARKFAAALKFSPAMHDGEPVFCYFVLPVKYKYVGP